MKNRISFLLLLMISIAQVDAQPGNPSSREPATAYGKMYLPIWLEAKRHCLEVATTMPEELYGYKPTDVSKTFAEQMVHIAYTVELLCKRYVQGLEVQANQPDASKMSKAEIIKMLNDGFDYVTEVIYTVPQSQLDQTCKMYHSGNTVSRALALVYVQDHMANHRSKANLYIRMNNIQPPEYTW